MMDFTAYLMPEKRSSEQPDKIEGSIQNKALNNKNMKNREERV